MNVKCRCGQGFNIQADRYPHRIGCHVCGRHFNVWSDGSTSAEDEIDVAPPALDTAAIQAEPPPINSSSTSVAEGFPDGAQAELHVLDLQWASERDRYSLIPVFTILTSRMLSVAVGLVIFVCSGFLLEMALWTRSSEWSWAIAIAAAFSVFVSAYVYKKAHGLRKAETGWLAKRNNLRTPRIPADVLPYLADESRANRPAWHKWIFGVSLIAVLALAADFFFQQGVYWVGDRDLEVTFVVTDAETDQPIAGAEIDVQKGREGAFCSDCDGPFKLITDAQGSSRRICKNCMCYGYSGGQPLFRRKDTFSSHTPDWVFRVSSPGHEKSDPIYIGEPEFRRTIQRGDQFATMEVSIKLRRLPADK